MGILPVKSMARMDMPQAHVIALGDEAVAVRVPLDTGEEDPIMAGHGTWCLLDIPLAASAGIMFRTLADLYPLSGWRRKLMYFTLDAMRRARLLCIAGMAAAVILSVARVPASAAPPAEQGPVAIPRAVVPASAPASLPVATRSAEEVLFEQIAKLRNLPRVPAGKKLEEVPQIEQQLDAQLAKSLALTQEFLKKYPKSPNADDVQIQRLDTIRLQAVIHDKPLDEFRKEASRILAGDASEKVKSTVAFMLVQADLQDAYKALREDQHTPDEQKDAAWRETLARHASEYLDKYPKSEFAKEFYGVLIQMAVQNRDFDKANAMLEQLKANFPDEPAIPEITEFIQQAATTQAAETQAAATMSATTQRSAATRPTTTR